MIEIEKLALSGVVLIKPRRFDDHRGYFREVYNRYDLEQAGMPISFIQDNESYSAKRGTVRGIHYQLPPFAQDKLVRVLRGAVLDVVVDLRRDSPTFGEHLAVRLDAEVGTQILIPTGFGHAVCTLEDQTVVQYKVSRPYSPRHERGIAWGDPDLAIDWPVGAADAILSDRDRRLPRLGQLVADQLFGQPAPCL